jgi:hypothetical protein
MNLISLFHQQHLFKALSPLAFEYEYRKKLGGDYIFAALPEAEQHRVDEQLSRLWQHNDIGTWTRRYCSIRNAVDFNLLSRPIEAHTITNSVLTAKNIMTFASMEIEQAKSHLGDRMQRARVMWQTLYASPSTSAPPTSSTPSSPRGSQASQMVVGQLDPGIVPLTKRLRMKFREKSSGKT